MKIKKYHGKITISLQFIFIINIIFPGAVYCYIDPGTGSFIIQIIIAGVVGSLIVIKIFFKRVKDFFRKRKNNDKEEKEN
ncbi:hypothetical protein ES703_88851 [subsurface metagenome]